MKVRAEIDFDILNAFSIDDFDGNKYLIGCGFIHNETHIVLDNGDQFPIKKDTRAIHFEDMIDSNNKAIFASLSEDRKGGDILHVSGSISYIPYYRFGEIKFEDFPMTHSKQPNLKNCKIIGIYE